LLGHQSVRNGMCMSDLEMHTEHVDEVTAERCQVFLLPTVKRHSHSLNILRCGTPQSTTKGQKESNENRAASLSAVVSQTLQCPFPDVKTGSVSILSENNWSREITRHFQCNATVGKTHPPIISGRVVDIVRPDAPNPICVINVLHIQKRFGIRFREQSQLREHVED
jgi:hypothetical protein